MKWILFQYCSMYTFYNHISGCFSKGINFFLWWLESTRTPCLRSEYTNSGWKGILLRNKSVKLYGLPDSVFVFFQIRGDNWLELCQDFLVVTVHCLCNSCSGQQLLSLFSGSIKRLMIINTSKSKRHILMRLQSLIVLLWAFFNSQFLKQQIMINWNQTKKFWDFSKLNWLQQIYDVY